MTFTLSEVLLLILTLAACTVSVYLARTLQSLDRTARDISKTLEEFRTLGRKLDGLLIEAERTVASARRLSEEGCAVVGNLSATSARVRETVEEGIEQFRGLFGPLRFLPLLLTGIKAGYEAFSRSRSGDPESDEESDD